MRAPHFWHRVSLGRWSLRDDKDTLRIDILSSTGIHSRPVSSPSALLISFIFIGFEDIDYWGIKQASGRLTTDSISLKSIYQATMQYPQDEARPSVDYSGTVEKILSQVDHRGEGAHEPLTIYEISALSNLCSVQSRPLEDLGFADVDPDVTGSLVELLSKHVAAAATVDIVSETYAMTQKIKQREVEFSFDQVSKSCDSALFGVSVNFVF
jgi:hypothetical protein